MSVAVKERCRGCGQFIGDNGQYGAVAPSDQFGDPDYDRAISVCSEACASKVMADTGHEHWFANEDGDA